jgi:hypothetical protein
LKRINLILLLLTASFCLHAQDESSPSSDLTARVTAYQDFRNYLYAFINGVPRQLESQPVRSFASLGDKIGYVNSANNLIAWVDNEKFNLGDATNTNYQLTNTLLVYQRDMVLAAFENGETTRLTYFLRDYKINDGMIAFRDQNIDMLRVYYKGKVTDVEYTLTGEMGRYEVGKNTLAYTNNANNFKVFLEGNLIQLDNIPPVDFATGRNITAYVSGTTRTFEALFNGKIVTLENLQPRAFHCGDELVAYVSDEGHFKVFQNGKLVKVESFPPDHFEVLDGTVLFFINNNLQVFQNGERFVLDQFMPASYQMNSDRIAWQDPQGRLYFFSNGQVQTVTSEQITEYNVNGDIVRFRPTDGSYRIYYKGKTY